MHQILIRLHGLRHCLYKSHWHLGEACMFPEPDLLSAKLALLLLAPCEHGRSLYSGGSWQIFASIESSGCFNDLSANLACHSSP